MGDENYVYTAEMNYSLFTGAITLPVDNQVIFARNMGDFLQRGQSREINIFLCGNSYKAQIRNVNFDEKFKRQKDTLQIRYPRNGSLAIALQQCFSKSYQYILSQREIRSAHNRSIIKLPEEYIEYIAIYTTEFEDTYIFETIDANDISYLKQATQNQQERVFETNFNYDAENTTSTIIEDKRIVKIRKLNKSIGDNLKLLYNYRCQICGQLIGDSYGTHVIEAHHIDYFVKSLNNNSNNQLIVCPNHHSIIHALNPIFDKKHLEYTYPNGFREGLVLNRHLP